MEFGLYLRSFLTDRSRPLHEQIDEAVEICHVARDEGFDAISVPQHWVSSPTMWPQPVPMLARMAPETGNMRLLSGIILLPLHNPVQVAEDAATLDHISKGRFTLGVGIGYRVTELEAAGTTRRDRAARLTESIALMKQLWTGEEVDFEGRYWQVHGARMGFTPVQQPHPPIWVACQSEGAVRRAARIADACYLAPQVGFSDLPPLIDAYHDERAANGLDRGFIAVSRCVSLAGSRAEAIAQARESAESSFRTYSTWDMQEATMVQIHISNESQISEFAVTGSAAECRHQLEGMRDDLGVDFVSTTFLNLPKDLASRRDYLQRFARAVIHKVR
jgi:alkanesulfonate monooxygenase SsuD/methylene tetrahydromethanopterin reductase-like flavin-dependent oxidoreductase (luciferase family)